MQDRAEIVHTNFLKRVKENALPDINTKLTDSGLSAAKFVQIFESQCLSRQLDNISRKLQAAGEGFYTIGSSGHEGNASIAAALELTDMGFLHYRDAAFFIQRSKLLPNATPMWDMLLSFTTSKEDPISGGRHKVLGSKELFIPPQTSTIASHLPKAVGAAHSVGINKRLGRTNTILPSDSIVLCSFGDASLNHSTAQGALNTASWTSYQNVPLPIVFVCEDNGIGISVPTPPDWVKQSMSNRPGIKYFSCNGLDIIDTYRVANEVQTYTRRTRKPAFLHMKCVRLFGHAGPDAQHMYLSTQEIDKMEENDPLLYSAALALNNNILNAEEVIDLYSSIGERAERASKQVIMRPKMQTAHEVMRSITPPPRKVSVKESLKQKREQIFSDDASLMKQPQHMAKILSWTLADLMLEHDNIIAAGEDIGKKGGVYTVTQKLQQRFGAHRVIDTLLDEQSILGLGIGMAHNDILPIPEIQFLAYIHNAEDQIRGEAATLSFFSNGQYTNPMVIRIAGLGYQKGFGGHFHNDNSIAALRDIPGVIIACPSNGQDASEMLRECVRLANEEQRVVIFLEPIALYMTKDLHDPKDNKWAHIYTEPAKAKPINFGEIGVHGEGKDLCIISYANGYYLSRKACKDIESKGIKTRAIDIRWLNPLNIESITAAAKPCKNILIVDECRTTGSLAHELCSHLERNLPDHSISILAAQDSFIPLGRVATVTMPNEQDIVEAALSLAEHTKKKKTG